MIDCACPDQRESARKALHLVSLVTCSWLLWGLISVSALLGPFVPIKRKSYQAYPPVLDGREDYTTLV